MLQKAIQSAEMIYNVFDIWERKVELDINTLLATAGQPRDQRRGVGIFDLHYLFLLRSLVQSGTLLVFPIRPFQHGAK